MKRREFFEKAGLGSAALVSVSALGDGLTTSAEAQGHEHDTVDGPLANATVSFGEWRTDLTPSLDRYPNLSPIAANAHHVIPFETKIKVGGSVNFIISGLHQVIVYGPGTKPEDINTALIRPTTGVPAGVPLINDPNNRLYAGPDPSTFVWVPVPPSVNPVLRDRSEVVRFSQKGVHLVICGVLPHFMEGMFGYVRVLP